MQLMKYFERLEKNHSTYFNIANVLVLPVYYFHCVPNYVTLNFQGELNSVERSSVAAEYKTSNTIAIHWWQKSWQVAHA